MQGLWLAVCEAGLDALAWRRHRQDRSPGASRRALGEAGERRAYFFVRRQGYVVVARQWRAAHVDGEVDLIAWQGETLCFIEVKTRSERDRFAADRTIGVSKQRALRAMARAYLRGLYNEDEPKPLIRFDTVAVLRHQRRWRADLQQGVAFQPDA